jgi:uroporphyrinogen decarboxylase
MEGQMATGKENFYKQMALDGDDPVVRTGVGIGYGVWEKYKEKLDWMEGFSKYAGVGISRSPGVKANTEVTNMWGERWIYPLDSLDGICIEHPILSFDAIKTYVPPDPDKFADWKQVKENFQKNNELGHVNHGGTDHGFIFLRSTYMRGYNNFMLDIGEERPEVLDLIKIIENYWFEVVRRYIECGVNAMGFGDDMGTQTALPISLEDWRKYIKPSYKRIFSYCRAHGVHVSLHSDGYINDIIPDLIECGVSNINPQDLVNGLDNIKRLAYGKVYIHLDIDRQNITVLGTPEQVDAHIFNCIKTLGSPKGGLSMVWGVYPGTPIENIEAGVRAMDKYATYWVGREN